MKNWLIRNAFIFPAVFAVLFGLVLGPLVPNVAARCPDGYIETGVLGEDHNGVNCVPGNRSGGGIWYILNLVMQILTWGVGIVAVLGVVIASIVYTTAGGDEGKVKLAKTMVFNIAIGLVLYALLWAILNFILPNTIGPGGSGTNPYGGANQP